MAQNKYEQLLERSVRAQEESNNVSKSLLEVAKGLQDNIKQLNDNFVLHSANDNLVCNEVTEIRSLLLKWVKWLAIALFVAVGGATILRILGIDVSGIFT